MQHPSVPLFHTFLQLDCTDPELLYYPLFAVHTSSSVPATSLWPSQNILRGGDIGQNMHNYAIKSEPLVNEPVMSIKAMDKVARRLSEVTRPQNGIKKRIVTKAQPYVKDTNWTWYVCDMSQEKQLEEKQLVITRNIYQKKQRPYDGLIHKLSFQ